MRVQIKIKCFFFQAEDGIRDRLVTGVQTCALPISNSVKPVPAKQYQQPKLIEFSPHTPAPLVTQTIRQPPLSPAHSKSPRPPSLWPGKPLLQIAAANASPSFEHSFSTPSPRKGVTVRTVSGELNDSPLKISPAQGVATVERWIPTPKTHPVQIASKIGRAHV